MPKQVLFQLRMIKTHESDKGLWDTLIEDSSTGYGNYIMEEVSVLRYHLGIQSEYCHISNYQGSYEGCEHNFHSHSNGHYRKL